MTFWNIIDPLTGCTWLNGASFKDKWNAERVCRELRQKYQNFRLQVKGLQ